MKHILGNEYPAFEKSFSDDAVRGVHMNPQRCNQEILLNCGDFQFTPSKNIKFGFYFSSSNPSALPLGAHPIHHGGGIYSQDPSAMLPVNGIDISSDWRVLDLCAAPGGKSSQIASRLSDQGFLLANEPHPTRNKILISNMERMGYRNVLVTKLSPAELALFYPCFFHMVLVDAPCSGEGMFRKYPESVSEWSPENVTACSERQKEILNHAVNTLRPGGYLIYSTCTYSIEENEDIVQWLIQEQHLEPVSIPDPILEVTAPPLSGPADCQRRIYPHLYRGEGQFMACLKKPGTLSETRRPAENRATSVLTGISVKKMALVKDALEDHFDLSGYALYEYTDPRHDKIIILPGNTDIILPPHGIALYGVTAGTIEKNRFMPHHHFMHAYGQLCRNRLDLTADDPRVYQYLNGQEIVDPTAAKGYGVVCYEGCPIGGFKASNGRLKNHYPKALRNQLLHP